MNGEIKHKQEGDSENTRLSVRDRKSLDLFNIVSEDYSMPTGSPEKEKVDEWVNGLAKDAQFNFLLTQNASYLKT
jgi:hypothetical protein